MKPLLIALLATIALPASESAFASLSGIFIKDCYEGDTYTLKAKKIRLACIDSRELKGWKEDPISSKEARDSVNKLVANEEFSIKRITNDRYGRTVGELFKNTVNIQELIVIKGYERIYKKIDLSI